MDHLRDTDITLYRWARLGGEIGLRSFEVAKVAGRDLDASSRRLRVIGKGRLDTTVDVPDDLFEDLWSLAQSNSGPLWPGAINRLVSSSVAIAAAQVGVHLGFHQFRHTAITRYYQRSRDLVAPQEFARHQSPETTAIYALADRKNHRRILNNLHSGQHGQPEPDDTPRDDDAELTAVLRRFGLRADDLLRLLLERRSGETQDD